jgi:hypothetical protein
LNRFIALSLKSAQVIELKKSATCLPTTADYIVSCCGRLTRT